MTAPLAAAGMDRAEQPLAEARRVGPAVGLSADASTLVLRALDRATTERDQARGLAASLEAQLAAVDALCDEAERAQDPLGPPSEFIDALRRATHPEEAS